MIDIEKHKIKTTLTENILEQIKYLNNKIFNEEWSGILFYKLTGTVEKIEELEIQLVDILPMDKGSTAATNFEYNKVFIDYLDKNPHLTDCVQGLIHSHNNMAK